MWGLFKRIWGNLLRSADFFDMVKPEKTKTTVVMTDPVNLKSSVEHMAVAKGAMRSQILQLITLKERVHEAEAKNPIVNTPLLVRPGRARQLIPTQE